MDQSERDLVLDWWRGRIESAEGLLLKLEGALENSRANLLEAGVLQDKELAADLDETLRRVASLRLAAADIRKALAAKYPPREDQS